MDIKCFYFNEFRECCYVVWDETREAAIIDPGAKGEREFSRIRKFVDENSLTVKAILLTHGHFDHTLGLNASVSLWKVKVYVHRNELGRILNPDPLSAVFGMQAEAYCGEYEEIGDGDKLTFGKTSLEILSTPGHTEGGVCFLNREDRILFSGDTLFAGSIGRTDHPGGDYKQLMESIQEKLSVLDSDTKVYPGHGPSTDIGYEMTTNPFLQPY